MSNYLKNTDPGEEGEEHGGGQLPDEPLDGREDSPGRCTQIKEDTGPGRLPQLYQKPGAPNRLN